MVVMILDFDYFIEEIFLVLALSIDAFICCFSYGINKIAIKFPSKIVISLICTAFTGISMLAGIALDGILSENSGKIISFIILISLGIIKLFDSIIKSIIKKSVINKNIHFSMLSLKFTLNIYASPIEADVDKSANLSPIEAASLAIALSLDGLGVGLGVGLMGYNIITVVLMSLVFTILAIISGEQLGKKLSKVSKHDWSFVSGIVIIVLALIKIIF